MIKTPNLKLPIYNTPDVDVFALDEWNEANQTLENVYVELKQDKQEIKDYTDNSVSLVNNTKDEMIALRQSIIETNADAEIVDARKGFTTLGGRLDGVDQALTQELININNSVEGKLEEADATINQLSTSINNTLNEKVIEINENVEEELSKIQEKVGYSKSSLVPIDDDDWVKPGVVLSANDYPELYNVSGSSVNISSIENSYVVTGYVQELGSTTNIIHIDNGDMLISNGTSGTATFYLYKKDSDTYSRYTYEALNTSKYTTLVCIPFKRGEYYYSIALQSDYSSLLSPTYHLTRMTFEEEASRYKEVLRTSLNANHYGSYYNFDFFIHEDRVFVPSDNKRYNVSSFVISNSPTETCTLEKKTTLSEVDYENFYRPINTKAFVRFELNNPLPLTLNIVDKFSVEKTLTLTPAQAQTGSNNFAHITGIDEDRFVITASTLTTITNFLVNATTGTYVQLNEETFDNNVYDISKMMNYKILRHGVKLSDREFVMPGFSPIAIDYSFVKVILNEDGTYNSMVKLPIQVPNTDSTAIAKIGTASYYGVDIFFSTYEKSASSARGYSMFIKNSRLHIAYVTSKSTNGYTPYILKYESNSFDSFIIEEGSLQNYIKAR